MPTYNPYDVVVIQRNSLSSSFIEKTLSSQPNSFLLFNSASQMVSVSTASFAGGLIGGATYSITASWAVNVVNGSTVTSVPSASWASSSLSSSYVSGSNAKIIAGDLYVLSNLSQWWKLSVYDDGSGSVTPQLDGPY